MKIVEATLNGRWKMKLPDHRAERPEWYTEKGWEKPRLEALHDVIKKQKKPVVYYVGAEEGEMPALCQMWGAKTIMFEPNELVAPNIKAIWQANGLDDFTFYPCFAGNADEPVKKLGIDDVTGEVIGNHGFKELKDRHITHIPCVKLDTIAKTEPQPTIITMDVEGAEYEVLRGAETTIQTQKPTIILSLHPEFLFRDWGVFSYDVRSWIKDRGYTEKLIEYEHEVHLLYEATK